MTQLPPAGLSNSQDIAIPCEDNTSLQTYNPTETKQRLCILCPPCTDGSVSIVLNPSNMVQGSLGPNAVQPVHPKMAAFSNSIYTAQHNEGHHSTKMICPTDNNLDISAILNSEEMMPNAMEQGSHRSISAQPGGAGMAVSTQGFRNLYRTNCSSSNSFSSIPDVPMTGQLNPSTMEQGSLRSDLIQPSGVGMTASTTGLINNAHSNIPEVSRPEEMNPSTYSSIRCISSQPAEAGMVAFPHGSTSTAQHIGGGGSSMMLSPGGDDHSFWNDLTEFQELPGDTNYLERGIQMQWNRGQSEPFQPNSSMLEADDTCDYAPQMEN